MDDKNKDWQDEQQRVDAVLNEIDKKAVKLQGSVGGLKEGIIDLRKNFWEDVTVNFDEPDDIIESQASIKQQAELLSERERRHGQVSDKLKTLGRLKDSPYFGRIDFLEDGEKQTDILYIGVASLIDEDDRDFLIYDWRAPISSLYYDYSPGMARYDTMEGPIKGDMTLKRQFIIRNGLVSGMFDTGVTIGDQLLQKVLGNNASTQMKSIVATIQKEQNQIIRNEKSRFLIVQGVAGSGKTSAALQRVAYLLYSHRKSLHSDNIILFSPNPLFNSYVATVLPELGENNMLQTTYHDYIEDRLKRRLRLEGPFKQMEYVLTAFKDPGYQARIEGIRYKAGLAFKDLVDRYVEDLGSKGLAFKNISFQNNILISATEIAVYFYSLDSSISIPNRMNLVVEWLLGKLVMIERKERAKDWVEEESQLLEKEDYLQVYNKLQKDHRYNGDTFDDADREEELLRKIIIKKHFGPIKKRVKRLDFVNIKATYRRLFENRLKENGQPNNWNEICKETIEGLDRHELSWEDATPYLYVEDQLLGRTPDTQIRHVFVDEAQDYSPFQLAYFRNVFPSSKMTLLGDLNQAIYAHSLNSETLLSNDLYHGETFEKITLLRSYRSTRQITNFTKALIAEGDKIEPFNRNGAKPELIQVNDTDNLHTDIVRRINEFQTEGHETIAVICKTMEESISAFEQLKSELNIKLIDQETYSFKKGCVVIPVYLAKGIEFDAVVIYSASKTEYHREIERNLFYTACTRAMHELTLFSLGEKTHFLDDVPSDAYVQVPAAIATGATKREG